MKSCICHLIPQTSTELRNAGHGSRVESANKSSILTLFERLWNLSYVWRPNSSRYCYILQFVGSKIAINKNGRAINTLPFYNFLFETQIPNPTQRLGVIIPDAVEN